MTAARATHAIEDVAQLGVERVALPALMPLAWRHRGSLTCYDALYVSLAMTTGYPLLTADARLARSARRLCRVQLVA